MSRSQGLKVLASVLALLLIWLMHSRWLDQYGEDYTAQGLKRVLVTYAVARGLNGLISVAQGTEISIEPAGVGMTFTPGQILAPINDLIERFSWVLLASGVSLGIQLMLLKITGWQGFAWLISLILLATMVIWWRSESSKLFSMMSRITLVLILLRFSVPMIALVNQGIYLAFLQDEFTSSSQVLEQASEDIQQDAAQQNSTQTQSQTDSSLMDKLKRMYDSAAHAVDVQGQFDKLKQHVADLSEHIFNIIVVFMLQTILFPLVLLWIMYRVSQSLLSAVSL